uniref:HAT C-terminal dimerisation domain-containing protein n=1 Tax=Lactuca sativa TaxID=4236 RepID=A0A9R1UMR2_LACSA|nr:hypothetical protein LSAT_V11C800415890 [Lactuca sativa]
MVDNANTVVHLTTDTWTSSCKKVNYMVVTAHFIDDEWVMHKRVINFREIDTHKGEEIGRELLACIHGWGMKNVMSMTVDNATCNDTAIEFLVKMFPTIYDGGKHFHIRCMTHILNLIVKVGLKYHNYHVECVQKAVKYIRGSTQRIKKFKKAIKDVGLETKKFLCGDSPTRWNSTFELLKTAYKLWEAFVEFGIKEKSYEKDLQRVPDRMDFEEIKEMVDFLEKFKTKTENVSASTKPLVHRLIREILDVNLHLKKWSTKVNFVHLIPDMKDKYDKYWGDYAKMSDYIYFVILLDPTMKSQLLLYTFKEMIGSKGEKLSKSEIELKAYEMIYEVERKIDKFFKTYVEKYDMSGSSQQQSSQQVVDCDEDNDFFGNFLNSGGDNSDALENELIIYLKEPRVTYNKSFDILSWWKLNGLRFPIVARMAKDILGIQISTVASESAFSTSRRVLTDYRANLSNVIVEALLCTQDWVRKSRKPIIDNVDDILNDDEVAMEIEEALHNDKAMGKRPMEK